MANLHNSAMSRRKVVFKHLVPVEVSRAVFKVSNAFLYIDPVKLGEKSSVEIEVGTFEGKGVGCGSTLTAIVKKGQVVKVRVSPCAEVVPIRMDASLKALMVDARKQLGASGAPTKFRPMMFSEFQQQGLPPEWASIVCVHFCVLGQCYMCCSDGRGGGTYCFGTVGERAGS